MENEKPDYEIAREECKKAYEDIPDLRCQIGQPSVSVQTTEKEKYYYLKFPVTFKKGEHVFETTYSIGTGFIDWNRLARVCPSWNSLNGLLCAIVRKPSARFVEMEKAVQYACEQYPKSLKEPLCPWEILASCCQDGIESATTTFEEWAVDLGYDPDSRKAEKVFFKCQEIYAALCRLLPYTTIKAFADFACRF